MFKYSAPRRGVTRALSFCGFFHGGKKAKVRAATLDSIMDRLALPRIDWFKTDSQGTDLQLFNSLREETRSRVLAVDLEPGLIDAYFGEDLFVDAHRDLTRQGFWLSKLDVCGTVRIRPSTLHQITAADAKIDYAFVEKTTKKSPGWVEARYFKTIESLIENSSGKRDYVML